MARKNTEINHITKTNLFVIGGISILVLGLVAYNFYLDKVQQNAKIRPVANKNVVTDLEYRLIGGSLYKVSDTQKLLTIDKQKLPISQLQTTDITSFSVSPDGSKILVSVEGGLSYPILFFKDTRTNELIEIGPGSDPVWAKNSLYIAYRLARTDIGPFTVQVFDTVSKKALSVTASSDDMNTSYGNIVWSEDSKSLQAEYTKYDVYPNGKILQNGYEKITVIQ
jgi:hypothetical protein